MQLEVARLCIDCDELHDQPQCPVCASESFAYLSRWVPIAEHRLKPRTPPPPTPRLAQPTTSSRTAAYGALGLGLAAVAGWWWNSRRRFEDYAERGAGELK